MKKSLIRKAYQDKLFKRDSLGMCLEEINDLLQDDNVKRYASLVEYYKDNSHLIGLSDEEVLDEVIEGSQVDEKKYFCMGKYFLGLPRLNGTYYLATGCVYRTASIVSFYKNLYNESDQVIIPTKNAAEFEDANDVVFAQTDDPDLEYKTVRRKVFLELIGEDFKEKTNNK